MYNAYCHLGRCSKVAPLQPCPESVSRRQLATTVPVRDSWRCTGALSVQINVGWAESPNRPTTPPGVTPASRA